MIAMRLTPFVFGLVVLAAAMLNRTALAQHTLWASYMQEANDLMKAEKGKEAVAILKAALRALDNDELFAQLYADDITDARLAVTHFNLGCAYKSQDDSENEQDAMSRAEAALKLVEDRAVARECENLLKRAAAERRAVRDLEMAKSSGHVALERLRREEMDSRLRMALLLEAQSRNLAELVSSMNVLSASLLYDGGERYAEYAERVLMVANELCSKFLEVGSVRNLEVNFALAELLSRTGRSTEALDRLTTLANAIDKKETMLIAAVLLKIAELHIGARAPDSAEPVLARAVSLASADQETPLYRKAVTAYRDVLVLMGRNDEAAVVDRQLNSE